MSNDVQNKIIVKLEKIEYLWYKKNWIVISNSVYSNMTVSTSLFQKLTEIAIKNNLLTLEDILENNLK